LCGGISCEELGLTGCFPAVPANVTAFSAKIHVVQLANPVFTQARTGSYEVGSCFVTDHSNGEIGAGLFPFVALWRIGHDLGPRWRIPRIHAQQYQNVFGDEIPYLGKKDQKRCLKPRKMLFNDRKQSE
jgi:hypothetical protein